MTAIVASRQNFHHPDNTSDSNTENNTMHSTREPAKNVFVYLNGNRYYPGRKFVVNRRYLHDFNGFLTEVTRGIKPSFGAIRNIYTPNQGHRVDDLKQLENNMELVAGGKEKFYQMGYRDIIARPRMMHNPKKVSLNKAPPKSRLQVPGRWRAYVKEPCQIYVYGNGDIIAPATKLLLTPRQMKSWDLVLQHITEKIGNRTGQAARKLYDLNYRLLHDPSELEGGQHYIAVGSEKLKRCPYGQIAALRGHNQISPRKANQPLPPIKRTQKQKKEDGDGQSFAKTQNKRKPKEEVVTSENVVTGLQPLKIKRQPQPPTTERPTNEKESVFHAKPVKVKRSPPVLTQTDEGGIFSANNKPEHADEVKEDENTKIDLPVDQIPAEIVNDEEINSISPREVSDLIVNNKDENSNDVANPQDLSNGLKLLKLSREIYKRKFEMKSDKKTDSLVGKSKEDLDKSIGDTTGKLSLKTTFTSLLPSRNLEIPVSTVFSASLNDTKLKNKNTPSSKSFSKLNKSHLKPSTKRLGNLKKYKPATNRSENISFVYSKSFRKESLSKSSQCEIEKSISTSHGFL